MKLLNKIQNIFTLLKYQLCWSHHSILKFSSRPEVGNLQGIAGHIARMIFSAGHIYVLCAKSEKSFSENLVESKKKAKTG